MTDELKIHFISFHEALIEKSSGNQLMNNKNILCCRVTKSLKLILNDIWYDSQYKELQFWPETERNWILIQHVPHLFVKIRFFNRINVALKRGQIDSKLFGLRITECHLRNKKASFETQHTLTDWHIFL